VFHTAASLATERDQVHLDQALRLPFFLPGDAVAHKNAASIVAKIVAKLRRLEAEMKTDAERMLKNAKKPKFGPLFDDSEDSGTDAENRERWLNCQRERASKLQTEINPLIYDYFGLNTQERTLVEDTCDIFDKSDTPGKFDWTRKIPTLQPLNAAGLEPYGVMLAETLNGWATGSVRVYTSGGVDDEYGLGLIEVSQARAPRPFQTHSISKALATALERIQGASAERHGRLVFQRSGWFFDGKRIILVKPALKGEWTRTAALNDAAELSAHIAEARSLSKRK